MTIPRGFTRCDECEGKGYVNKDYWPRDADECPSCSGSGLVPTEKLREDTARTIADFHQSTRPGWELAAFEEVYRRETDAVLRKVAEHIGEGP